MDDRWKVLAATHLLAVGATYALVPKERLDHEVAYKGIFGVEVRRTLAAAVLSLRSEDKLLVYTYRGVAHVSVERTEFLGLFSSSQEMALPASVSFFVDLSQLGSTDISYDEQARLVTVRLPPLVLGEIAMQSELANVRSSGLMSLSDRHVQDLTKASYLRARETFIASAQNETLRTAAEAQARANVGRHFSLALGAAGHRDVRVVATFDGRRAAPKT